MVGEMKEGRGGVRIGSYCANVGQQGEDFDAIRKKALDCGAIKVE